MSGAGRAPERNVDRPEFWSGLYRSGTATWDLGGPTPVFAGLLASGRLPPGAMLVPGCGSAHDAAAFAGAGFRVTAVDFSPEPLRAAADLARRLGVTMNLLQADFFSLDGEHTAAYDYVLEYVTYCAIDPGRRGEYASVLARVLKPGGVLIALLFPVEQRTGGPPFGIDLEEAERLFSPWFLLRYRESQAATIRPRRGREILLLLERRP